METCAFCRRKIEADEAWKQSGQFFCSEFCADGEPASMFPETPPAPAPQPHP
jgi:hypothetical protein